MHYDDDEDDDDDDDDEEAEFCNRTFLCALGVGIKVLCKEIGEGLVGVMGMIRGLDVDTDMGSWCAVDFLVFCIL